MKAAMIEMLTQVAIALVGLASSYVIFYLSKAGQKVKLQIQEIKDEKQRKLFNDALVSFQSITKTTVAQIEQTVAKDLRKLVKDGTVDKSELKELSKEAYEEIKSMLKPEYQKILSENINNFENYMLSCIEEQVLALKNNSLTELISTEISSIE